MLSLAHSKKKKSSFHNIRRRRLHNIFQRGIYIQPPKSTPVQPFTLHNFGETSFSMYINKYNSHVQQHLSTKYYIHTIMLKHIIISIACTRTHTAQSREHTHTQLGKLEKQQIEPVHHHHHSPFRFSLKKIKRKLHIHTNNTTHIFTQKTI